jgi:hypothetical protein
MKKIGKLGLETTLCEGTASQNKEGKSGFWPENRQKLVAGNDVIAYNVVVFDNRSGFTTAWIRPFWGQERVGSGGERESVNRNRGRG